MSSLNVLSFRFLCFIVLTAGSWIKNLDYYRLDGSTSAPLRKKWADQFNNASNDRYRLSNCYSNLSKYIDYTLIRSRENVSL